MAPSYSSSSTVRFSGFFDRQPSNSPNADSNNSLELDESDVVWSSYSTDSDSHSPSNHSLYPSSHLHRLPSHGLSAALSHEQHTPLVCRKSALNPSISAASAAKAIPPVFRSDNLNMSSNNGIGAGRFHQSAPMNVPVWPKKKAGNFGDLDRLDELDQDELNDDEEEMVPPHEIVARSHMMFSVFEGAGRTLKGRDLRRVRNAVFQQTGFID